ncbi:MAG: hypothetical protein GDA51_07735 [Ekhidna sp.]|nr:hypothetical protein [Ekhidna sp.]MBC6411295.1 hypothetical protein [Ekhidna sp.]MBC6426344.1 hypothetical protein [Ekhidna sp.]
MISELKALDMLTLKFKLSKLDVREVIQNLREREDPFGDQVDKAFDKRQNTFLTKDDKVEPVEKIEKNRSDMIKRGFIFEPTLVF